MCMPYELFLLQCKAFSGPQRKELFKGILASQTSCLPNPQLQMEFAVSHQAYWCHFNTYWNGMLAKIWPTHFKNTSPLLWKNSFTLKIWPPLYGKDIHLWRQEPTTTARSKQLRQLHRRCLPICCLDPAVHHREEQGHQEVPWWALRLREDHHRQGWSLGEQWSVTTNQVISGFQSLSLLCALMEK